MSTSGVTVPGGGNNAVITLGSANDASAVIARSIGAALAATTVTGGVNVTSTTATTTGTLPAAPSTPGLQVLELTGTSVNVTIPDTYSAVYDISSTPATITGSNLALEADVGGGLFIVSGNSSIGAVGGQNTISATGTYQIGAGDGNNIVFATGTGTILGGSGANTVVAAGATYVKSIGTDLIAANGGPVSVDAYGRHSGIIGGNSGSITTNLEANDVTVSAAGMNLAATVYGSNALIFGGSGTTRLSMGDGAVGAGATIAGGAGDETIDASGGGLGDAPLLFDSTGAVNFHGGAGTPTIIGGTLSGSTQATVGAGGLLFATGNNNISTITVNGFSGNASILGGSGSSVTLNGTDDSGNELFAAGAGNETLNAAGSSSTNTFFAGSGNETLSGGSNSNAFYFFAGSTGGQDVITNFNPSFDDVYLIGYSSYANTIGTSINPAVVTLSDSTTIKFSNVITQPETDSLTAHIHVVST